IDLTGNKFNNTITGNAGANVLSGEAGNDLITGGAGDDTIDGGTGTDTEVFSGPIAASTVSTVGGVTTVTGPNGTDTLTNVEFLRFSNGTLVVGGGGGQYFQGTASGNTLTGTAFNDVLDGLGSNDTLIGGLGEDRMIGGVGNDVYHVDNAGDVIVEAVGEGTDRVLASVSYSLASTAEVELLLTNDAAGVDDIDLTGNGFANSITGNAGANRLTGAAGDDTLFGLDGNDFLNGGTGADRMIGGAGNDIYMVDDLGDVITESVGGGSDQVRASTSYVLAAGAEVELLLTTNANGTAAIDLTGNRFDNTILGNAGANVLTGGTGNDTINGGGGTDTAVFSGLRSAYTISTTGGVTTVAGPDGTDSLTNVEQLQFDDGLHDLAGDPIGGGAPLMADFMQSDPFLLKGDDEDGFEVLPAGFGPDGLKGEVEGSDPLVLPGLEPGLDRLESLDRPAETPRDDGRMLTLDDDFIGEFAAAPFGFGPGDDALFMDQGLKDGGLDGADPLVLPGLEAGPLTRADRLELLAQRLNDDGHMQRVDDEFLLSPADKPWLERGDGFA
ncbi:MAG: calcium-binding protein, partial [Brevundimonas sp.]